MSDEDVMALTSDELLTMVKDVLGKQHTILFYGPQTEADAKSIIAEHHKSSDNLEKLVKKYSKKQVIADSKVIIAPYDSRQFNYIQYSDRGEKFSISDVPSIELFNEYYVKPELLHTAPAHTFHHLHIWMILTASMQELVPRMISLRLPLMHLI